MGRQVRPILNGAAVALALAGLALASVACGGSGSSQAATSKHGGKLNLVAYSTPEAAYAKLIPAFTRTAAGKGVSFTQSYGASGDQSRAVAAGQPADVVQFALEPDIQRLVDAHMVAPSWDRNRYRGILSESVVVIAVRKGNPKHIHGWSDLVKPGVQVITPNPFTSGGARWNIMAAYGAQLKQGKTPAQAVQYLDALFHHVPVQDDKASAALETFASGKGDALLTYENEAILAQRSGTDIQYIVPDQTILIQTPVAVTSNSQNPTVARAFVRFLYSDAAQRIFGQTGYRPVNPRVAAQFHFPRPAQLFTIQSVGGWTSVMTKFFDPTNSVMQKIEQSIGVSTGG